MWTKALYLEIFVLLLHFRSSYQIACKNEKNADVNWYINYKLPKIDAEPSGSNLAEGTAYTYILAPGSSWKLSKKNVTSGSMLESTLNNFYSNKEELTYLLYNDDPPENFSGTAVGHLKGVLAFDGTSGFWLVHSIPKFPGDSMYKYPDNALVNGQSILCVTLRTAELNEISYQLLYSHPNIYSHGITDEVKSFLDNTARTLFTDNPSFIRRQPLIRSTSLKSLDNKIFTSFAKDNQYEEDLYSGIIAPSLKTSLLAETWRRGSGSFLPPSCQSNYTVLDVVNINMTAKFGRNKKNIFFKSTEDHSKWAVAQNGFSNWICIGDLNRMASQKRRGGGALCFVSASVRKAFHCIIDETDQCPV